VARKTSLLVALLAAAPLALAACGGNDPDEADQTVRDFVKAANERDGDKFCGELVTKEFLEQTTRARGTAAEKQCKDQLRSLKSLHVRLVKIKKTTVEGDRAKVTATLRAQGQTADQVLRLKKEDGRFKLAGG
jgi:predicted lipid-binding transport protein (Tim44 family)